MINPIPEDKVSYALPDESGNRAQILWIDEARTRRVLGQEAGDAWLAQLRVICPRTSRLFVRPEWVGLLDFTTRFPSAIERALAGG